MGRIVTRVMFRVTKLIITCTQIQGLTRPHALPEELQFFSLGFLIVILLQKTPNATLLIKALTWSEPDISSDLRCRPSLRGLDEGAAPEDIMWVGQAGRLWNREKFRV